MNSPDPKVSQGNACVNVTGFFSVGGGACRVVRLNERPRVRPAELLATPAARHPRPIGVRFTVLGCRWLAIDRLYFKKIYPQKTHGLSRGRARKDARGGAAMPHAHGGRGRGAVDVEPGPRPRPGPPRPRHTDTGHRGAGSGVHGRALRPGGPDTGDVLHAGVEPHHRSRADIVWSVRACEGIVRVPLFSSKLQYHPTKAYSETGKKGGRQVGGEDKGAKESRACGMSKTKTSHSPYNYINFQ